MARRKSQRDATVKLIVRFDGALNHEIKDFDDRYDEYLETLDESRLPMIEGEEPTRVVLKLNLDWDVAGFLRKSQVSVNKKGHMEIDPSTFREEAAFAICDIENPTTISEEEKIVWKPEANTGLMRFKTATSVMKEFSQQEIQDIFNARNNALRRGCGTINISTETKKSSQHSLNSPSQITVS